MGKSSMEVIRKDHYHLGGEGGNIRQNTVVIWWLILCISTKLLGVICLSACIS